MNAQVQAELLTLVFLVLIVGRFLIRELRARMVRLSNLWVRPAILAALTAFLIWATLQTASASRALLAPSLVAGAVVGLVVGILVAASTRVESVGQPGVVRLHGSWVTVAIWVGALALRVLARFTIGGSLFAASPAVNSGTVMLVAVAFTTFAVLVAQRVRTLGLG